MYWFNQYCSNPDIDDSARPYTFFKRYVPLEEPDNIKAALKCSLPIIYNVTQDRYTTKATFADQEQRHLLIVASTRLLNINAKS